MPGLVPGIHVFLHRNDQRRGWHPKSAVADFGNLSLQAGSNRLADEPGHDE
jgi:hypothetical protein